jgi:cytochrome c nitrite reductase small subunit
VPNNNPVTKLLFEGMDGVKHTAAFTFLNEPQVITAGAMSSSVIMNNCIRCHTQLNTEIVNAGRITSSMAAKGEGKLCWDCHRDVPHGRNSLSSTENAPVPFSGI